MFFLKPSEVVSDTEKYSKLKYVFGVLRNGPIVCSLVLLFIHSFLCSFILYNTACDTINITLLLPTQLYAKPRYLTAAKLSGDIWENFKNFFLGTSTITHYMTSFVLSRTDRYWIIFLFRREVKLLLEMATLGGYKIFSSAIKNATNVMPLLWLPSDSFANDTYQYWLSKSHQVKEFHMKVVCRSNYSF